MSESATRAGRDWVYAGVLTVIGLLLIWWAGEQFTEIRRVGGSEFRYPRAGLLFYLLTLVGAGVVFGVATSFGGETRPGRRRAIALWSLLPLLATGGFYSILALGWPGGPLTVTLTNPVIHIASSVTLGFYLSRLASRGRRLAVDENHS